MNINFLLQAPGPDHFLFQNGKINTVAIVVLIIWGGTLAFLMATDRKVSRLEKKAEALREQLEQKNRNKASN